MDVPELVTRKVGNLGQGVGWVRGSETMMGVSVFQHNNLCVSRTRRASSDQICEGMGCSSRDTYFTCRMGFHERKRFGEVGFCVRALSRYFFRLSFRTVQSSDSILNSAVHQSFFCEWASDA